MRLWALKETLSATDSAVVHQGCVYLYLCSSCPCLSRVKRLLSMPALGLDRSQV